MSGMVGRGCGQELYEREGVVQGETGEEDRLRQSLLGDAADNEPYPRVMVGHRSALSRFVA